MIRLHRRIASACIPFAFLVLLGAFPAAASAEVKMWEDTLELPTYLKGPDDPNPMFFRPLSYQGASRVVYPYPLQENLTNRRETKAWKALYLENEYIKLCVLPEIGGRLFYATDKTNGYEMFYRQHVIKPSNIGMLGAWISGGVEWCVFHHHRASTFLPVNYRLADNPIDGSKTIWIGEIEPRHRMKWSIGITLYPGRSIVEAVIRMVNRTPETHSILHWANVAVHVNDDYQVIFPPSTKYGVYHAKNEFVHWPVARDRYRGVDYEGVDLSWWKNHPNPVSIFAHDLQEGFLAGYDHGRRAGLMHVANPHTVPGAKLWEWGPGPEGSMWDTKVLTDADGPYAELMAGAYSDNQPDYSWIKPYEVKTAVQTWYPLRETGGAKSANENAAVNLEVIDGRTIFLAFNVTQSHPGARVSLTAGDGVLLDERVDLDPATPYAIELPMPQYMEETGLEGALFSADGECLVRYRPETVEAPDELPPAVEPPPAPADIESAEELYFTGLRIKQFHNARLDPNAYFEEALRRDPLDSRCNIQLGLDAAARGLDGEAERFFKNAIERITKNYTRPRDCEAHYRLGVLLKRLGRPDEARDNLYRAAWDLEFRAAAYYQLAELNAQQGDMVKALECADESLAVNAINTRALTLRAAALRHLDRDEEAMRAAGRALGIDMLDFRAMNEHALALDALGRGLPAVSARREFERAIGDSPETRLEIAVEYRNAGMDGEAIRLLEDAVASETPGLCDYPTIHYYLAYLHERAGKPGAAELYQKAAGMPHGFCFPFRLETRDVLARAIEVNPGDARAYYYLGNLMYDRQPHEAIGHWEKAVELEPSLAIAHRNLGWGYWYAGNDIEKAIAAYKRAIDANPDDPRYYVELDSLMERNGASAEARLAILRPNHETLTRLEPALTREILALVLAGEYDTAIECLDTHYFHIQEGNRGLHDIHVDAHLLRGLSRLDNDPDAALEDFLRADDWPENHQVGRDRNYDRNPQIAYLAGAAYKASNQLDVAAAMFRRAAGEAGSRRGGNGLLLYYRGLAQSELGDGDAAAECFNRLIESGQRSLEREDGEDFFAKFGGGETADARAARAHLSIGLGKLGLGETAAARDAFQQAAKLDPANPWALHFADQTK